jgi:hypothetical protein
MRELQGSERHGKKKGKLMYNEIVKKLGTLSYAQLELIKKFVDDELNHRENLGSIAYKCPECDFQGQFGEVFAHLDEHEGYEEAIYKIYAPLEVYR